jgi:hypothetical protein
MEAAMTDTTNRHASEIENGFSSRKSTLDRSGFWLALVTILLALAAGIVIYRTGTAEIRTASIDLFPPYANIDGFDR